MIWNMFPGWKLWSCTRCGMMLKTRGETPVHTCTLEQNPDPPTQSHLNGEGE